MRALESFRRLPLVTGALLAGLLVVLSAGCAQEPTRLGEPALRGAPSEAVDFHLVISNQSFDIDPVDVRVFIDDTEVVTGDFFVGSQHTFHSFDFRLDPGLHTLRAIAADGTVTLEQELDLENERWGVLFFWYYPEETGGAGPTPKQLDFNLYDEAPAFD